jgi:LacI family transcriptional regulator
MKDIARVAGVSIATVSLVLNHRDGGRVGPEIVAKVRDAADSLNYKPNPLARSLRTNRTRILGFISEEIATTPFAGRIILGAQDAASLLGYVMITVNTDGISRESQQIEVLQGYGVDGCLYAKMSNRVTAVPEALDCSPLVLVDCSDVMHRHAGIAPDEFSIGYDATRQLLAAGCRKIAYIGCASPLLAQTRRFEGYRQALIDAGMHYSPALVANVLNNQEALDQVEALFESQSPDGFFCFNDARAWYVYELAARRGMHVGRDISVIGVDNHRVLAETLAPRLTTVELPHYEMGFWAACKLVSLIEDRLVTLEHMGERLAMPLPPVDRTSSDVTIHCRLIEKESVRPAPSARR